MTRWCCAASRASILWPISGRIWPACPSLWANMGWSCRVRRHYRIQIRIITLPYCVFSEMTCLFPSSSSSSLCRLHSVFGRRRVSRWLGQQGDVALWPLLRLLDRDGSHECGSLRVRWGSFMHKILTSLRSTPDGLSTICSFEVLYKLSKKN